MAVTNLTIAQVSSSLFQDTANGGTAIAVKASSATVTEFEVDNTANAAVSYAKFYNAAVGSVIVGTTAPDHIVFAPASTKTTQVIPSGLVFGTALTVSTVTTGGTGGTTSPTSSVAVRVVYT